MMRILALGILVLLILGCTDTAKTSEPAVDAALDADYIYLELGDIGTAMTHYEYDYNGARIKYFALRDSSGEIKVAFDACEVCYKSRKGYRQEGDAVVCNNCGLKFSTEDLGIKNKAAGCWPAHLPHMIEGEYVKISKKDIESGARFFA